MYRMNGYGLLWLLLVAMIALIVIQEMAARMGAVTGKGFAALIHGDFKYDNFVLDLEFKTESGTNSGVIVYCSDRRNWIPNSLENAER